VAFFLFFNIFAFFSPRETPGAGAAGGEKTGISGPRGLSGVWFLVFNFQILIIGDGVFKEVTEVQWGHGVALIQQDWVLRRGGHKDTDRGTTP
jgi:hypothetical protein